MYVEGVTYYINWQKFRPGTCLFIPCLNCTEAKRTVSEVTDRLQINVLMKTVVQEGVQGLRIWRM
jgi:hypothetical protein